MKAALVVIDVQNDFLEDSRLNPPKSRLLQAIGETLDYCRKKQIPVIHLHYITESDGRGLLPHHRKQNDARCLRGTREAAPAEVATPVEDEKVFAKQAYSGFASADFADHLRQQGLDTLVLCGLHTHACIRQTAIDALQTGYRVLIITDAVASYDSLHAEISRTFLSERGAELVSSSDLPERLSAPNQKVTKRTTNGLTHPVACVNGQWIERTVEETTELRNPSRWDEVLGFVPHATMSAVVSAVSAANRAQKDWQAEPMESRLCLVNQWFKRLEESFEDMLPWMMKEVGKPITACRAELDLLRNSIRVINETIGRETFEQICTETDSQVARARRRPLGVVAMLAPWNNPVFLPASKIAAALALGNAVVWKPALPCAKTSALIQESIAEAGIPTGLVNLVYGGPETARCLISQAQVKAVTLTGSVDTGRQVAALCGSYLKPLQAELGGNNAAIVTEHCDIMSVAEMVAMSAFGYAGQACTATRRVIVMKSIETGFLQHLKATVEKLFIGLPESETTVIGPVISRSQKQKINHLVSRLDDSVAVFASPVPEELEDKGCWLPSRIISGLSPEADLIQQETFAPVLVVQVAEDLAQAIHLCNAVPQGLISALFSDREQDQQFFRDTANTGVVQLNLPTRNLHMESPFGGWKASGLGPPEHGVWDLDFYTRWQAVNERK